MRNLNGSVPLLSCAILLSALTGCFSVPVESYSPGDYLTDRALDFIDIIDVKYSLSVGVGAKIEASDYIATGLGFGGLFNEHEFYGRRLEQRSPIFLHLILFGSDGFDNDLYITTLFYQRPVEDRFPMMFRWRFGGEVVLPIIAFGAYINFVEIADFIIGLSGFDIADDDGVAKGAPLWEYVDYSPLRDPSEYFYWYSYVPEKLKSRNYRVRLYAIEILEKRNDKLLIEPILRVFLYDENRYVRERALEALKSLSGEGFGNNRKIWLDWWRQIEELKRK